MVKKIIQKVVPLIMVLTLIFVSYRVYNVSTKKMIDEQNNFYALDTAKSIATYIDADFRKGIIAIQAYATYLEPYLVGPYLPEEDLKEMEVTGFFDAMRFAGSDGVNHATDGSVSDARDRDFYVYGMAGQSGVSIIDESRITGKGIVGFYTPVRYQGEIIGVLRGLYEAGAHLTNMLEADFFDVPALSMLIKKDGTIIASSMEMDEQYKNIYEYLLFEHLVGEEELFEIKASIMENKNKSLRIPDRDDISNIAVASLKSSELSVVLLFPQIVSARMYDSSDNQSIRLLLFMIGIGLGYIGYIAITNAISRKKLRQENRDLGFVYTSTKLQIKNIIVVDVPTSTYRNLFIDDFAPIEGYSGGILERQGEYEDYRKSVVHACFDSAERNKYEKLLGLDSILQNLKSTPNETLSYFIHLNYSTGEAFERKYINVVEKAKGKVKTILITNIDVTKAVQESRDAEEKISAALEIAERSNNAKSTFLANMSHEIRTPINAILGFNELVLSEKISEQVKNYSMDISSSGKILLSLVNDILDMSKIEAGKMEVIEENYELKPLLSDCRNMTLARLTGKDVKIIEDFVDLPASLYGDGLRVRQIMMNLLSNAAKYTAKGTITFTVLTEAVDKENLNLIVKVKDTGAGISDENKKKIFSAFERVEEEKNHYIEGTGLGLALVKRLLDLMNGSIKIESVVGEGSTFIAVIPQKKVFGEALKADGKGHEKEETLKKEAILFDASSMNILSVDDVALNRKLVEKFLEKINAHVDSASGGRDALDLLSKNKYDLVLIDHMMPDLDGIETFKQFKSTDNMLNKNTPFIILTANAVKGAKEDYLSEGFNEYLSKPITQEQLLKVVRKYYNIKH